MILNSVPPALPHVKAGRLRALGIAGATRAVLLPEVPTIDEATGLRGFQAGSW